MEPQPELERKAVAEAFGLLGVRNVLFGVQAPSFPGRPEEDLGRGSPYSLGAARLLEWAAGLGFTGVQLGPLGLTSEGNASPYDGAIFSRNPLDLALRELVEAGLLSRTSLERLLAARPKEASLRVPDSHVHALQETALTEAFESYAWGAASAQHQVREFRRANEEWLLPDALFGALSQEHGSGDFQRWPSVDRELWALPHGAAPSAAARLEELRGRYARAIERHAFEQQLLEGQHRLLRTRCAGLGLKLFGDLQVGLSTRDVWRHKALLLAGYALGAPPSRTTPAGQPWGYAVLDPAHYRRGREPGPALQLIHRRLERIFSDYDGLRVDHPHGLVDPWVYKTDRGDPFEAVRGGARLFSSPSLPEHPRLADYSIAQADQLDESKPRYADDRVRTLTETQVAAYACLIDELVAVLRHHGRDAGDLACEVLSTLPYPLSRVLARHGLGRFRVLQKADFSDPSDVYRPENVAPADWIMLGTHDTPSIWQQAKDWEVAGLLEARAAHLARRLAPEGQREKLYQRLRRSPGLVVHALLADALARGPRHLYVFFTDLLGIADTYNVPGTVSEANWSLRIPPTYESEYQQLRLEHRALNLPTVLSLALQAPHCAASARSELLRALDNAVSGNVR